MRRIATQESSAHLFLSSRDRQWESRANIPCFIRRARQDTGPIKRIAATCCRGLRSLQISLPRAFSVRFCESRPDTSLRLVALLRHVESLEPLTHDARNATRERFVGKYIPSATRRNEAHCTTRPTRRRNAGSTRRAYTLSVAAQR